MKNLYEEMFGHTFEYCFRILDFYECPAECGGVCCGNVDITFERFEYRKIKRAHPKVDRLLRGKTEKEVAIVKGHRFEAYTFTEHPCPLLTDDCRCSVHDVRPVVCHMYPFTAGKCNSNEYLSIDPCPLGIELMKDYVLFKTVVFQDELKEGDPMVTKVITEDIDNLKMIMEKAVNYKVLKTVPLMFVPFNLLPNAYKFLCATSREDRLHDRHQLGIE